jgi:hypothetical protein
MWRNELTRFFKFFLIFMGIFAFSIIFVYYPIFMFHAGPWTTASRDYTIKFLSIIISWPVVILIVILIFFSKFRDSFDYYLRNIKSVKLPGGTEIQSQTPAPMKGQRKIDKLIKELSESPKSSKFEQELADKTLDNAIKEIFDWKFKYLNLFLIPNSKVALKWFSKFRSPVTREIFHKAWSRTSSDKNQRNIILDVLIQNELISENRDELIIEELGNAFLEYLNIIQQLPRETNFDLTKLP